MFQSLLNKLLKTSLILAASISASHAGIIGALDADNKNFEWNSTEANYLQTFNEQQGIYLHNNQVQVDYLIGSNLSVGDTISGQKKTPRNLYLEQGYYNSHLLHFDPLGTHGGTDQQERITFDSNIVAIILSGARLNLSDAILGGDNASYEKSHSRKLESHDFLTFESNRTLLIDRVSVGRYWIDDARIITTQAVSEPGSLTLLSLGVLALLGIRKFQK